MAILNRDDFFTRVREHIGEDSSDDSIAFLEDMTDTYNDMEERIRNTDGEDWKKRFEELDESWKKRYRHRFFSGDNRMPNKSFDSNDNDGDNYDPESVKLSDLFKTN